MLAAAANVLCFPEALTDDVTNAGHGWAGMQSLWLTDWFSWANPPKQHMLETTDSCFPKEVSLCSLLLPETRSQRFQKSAKLRNSGYRERAGAQVASSRDIEIELFLPFLSPLLFLFFSLAFLFVWKFGKR